MQAVRWFASPQLPGTVQLGVLDQDYGNALVAIYGTVGGRPASA